MDNEYWLEKWELGSTRFHQYEVNELLKNYFPRNNNLTVLVPLCGKSLDMKWLADQGHKVVGIELSPLALGQFIDENKISAQMDSNGVLKNDQYTLIASDIFEVKELPQINAVYDRAATVALPKNLRQKYFEWVLPFLKEGTLYHIQLYQYHSQGIVGPPYSVEIDEIKNYLSSVDSKLLYRQEMPTPEHLEAKGMRNFIHECYHITI